MQKINAGNKIIRANNVQSEEWYMFIKAAAWKYIFILHVSLQPFQNFRYVIKV
jgi:hypothetical protein